MQVDAAQRKITEDMKNGASPDVIENDIAAELNILNPEVVEYLETINPESASTIELLIGPNGDLAGLNQLEQIIATASPDQKPQLEDIASKLNMRNGFVTQHLVEEFPPTFPQK